MVRRVVVTGLGMVTPLGNNVDSSWEGIINSKSGIKKISLFDTNDLPDSISKVAGEINVSEEDNNAFNPTLYIEKKDIVLNDDEKKHYQQLYDQVKEEHPDVKGKDFDRLFAQTIVKDAWAQKAMLEAQMENPLKAKEILFSKEKATQYTNQINSSLLRSRNAVSIVRNYGAEFSKGISRTAAPQKKVGLQQKLNKTQAQKKQKLKYC